MEKKNQLKSCCKINCHSVLDTESSTHDVSQRQQPRQTWKTLKQVQGDNPIFNNNKAFTLIELLVVVLIIGILSAVAVPQYQKAVGKVRYTQAKIYAHALADAQRAYYLANGTYSGDLEELDVQLPWKSVTNHPGSTLSSSWGDLGNGANCSITTAGEVNCRVRVAGTQLIYALILEHSSYTDSINTRTCATYSMNESSIQNQICKAETGLSTPTSTGVDAINWVYPD